MIGPTFDAWLLNTAIGGALLLLVSCLLMKACRQPAWRQRWGECGLAASLLLAGLTLGPRWLTVPLLAPEAANPGSEKTAANSTSAQEELTFALESQPSQNSVGPHAQEATEYFFNAYPPPPATVSEREAAMAPEPMDTSPSLFPLELQERMPPVQSSLWDKLTILRLDSFGALVDWLKVVYVLAAGFLLGRWSIGHIVLWRLLRSARPAPWPIAYLFGTMVHARHGHPRLLVSDRLRVPLSCGLWRPTVVLPASFCRPKAAGALRWVFAHELTHLERRDAWTCLFAGLGQAFYFYVPWFWWLRRQLRLCQEYIADAAAADQAGEPEDYAQFLLALTKKPALPLGALGVLGYSSDLFRRVTMLLQSPEPVEKRCPRWSSVGAAGSLVALAVLVSGISLRAQPVPFPVQEAQVVGADSADDDDEAPRPKQPSRKPPLPDPPPGPGVFPPGFDMQQMQEQIMRMQEQLRQMQQQLHQGQPQFAFQAQPGFAFFSTGGGQRLGAQVQTPGEALADQMDLPKGQGLVIVSVQPNSAAAKAGMKPHDILVEFNGKKVPSDPARFVHDLEGIKAKEAVDAVVLRKGKKRTIAEITLPEKGQNAPWGVFQGQFAPNPPGGLPGQPGGGFGSGFGNQPGGGFGSGFSGQPGGPPGVGFGAQPGGPGLDLPGFRFSGPGGRPGLGLGQKGKHVTTTINRNDGNFTAHYQEGSLSINVTGTVADGEAKVHGIGIHDGEENLKYGSVKEVPKQYRDKVQSLVDASARGDLNIEIKPPREKRKDKKGKDILEEDDDK